MEQKQKRPIIRTSEKDWFKKVVNAYKKRESFILIDDAGIGVDPINQTLLFMGKQAGLSKEEWIAVLALFSIAGIGAGIIVAAIIDPEPTSKLGLLTASGAILIFTGGFQAVRILAKVKPPRVVVKKDNIEFEIYWD